MYVFLICFSLSKLKIFFAFVFFSIISSPKNKLYATNCVCFNCYSEISLIGNYIVQCLNTKKIVFYFLLTNKKRIFFTFSKFRIYSTRATRSTENSRYYRMTISIELNVGFVFSTPIYVSSIKAFSHESLTREQKNPFFRIRGRTKHPFK